MTILKTLLFLIIGITILSCSSPTANGPSDIPNMANPNIYVEIPSCLAEKSTDYQLVKQLDTKEETNLLNFYKPIPQFIKIADSAQYFVQQIMDAIEKENLPYNTTITSNNKEYQTIFVQDSANEKFYSLNMRQNNKDLLKLTYFSNKQNKIRAELRFTDQSNGTITNITFNNQEQITSSVIIIHNTNFDSATMENQPKTIRVYVTKDGNNISVSGSTYHPNSSNNEFDFKPRFYVFNANILEKENVAALTVALVPKNATSNDYFKNYSLDQIIMRYYLQSFKQVFKRDSNLTKAVKWSITNNEPIPLLEDKTNINWISISQTEILDFITTFSTEQLTKFTTLNREWMNSNNDLKSLVTVVETKQPLFYRENNEIFGNGFDIPTGFEGLVSDSIPTIDTHELINYK